MSNQSKINYPFPEPQELWGDCLIRNWPRKERNLFVAYLFGIASSIIFTDQSVIDRVSSTVKDIILKAKSGEILPEVALEMVKIDNIFSQEEREKIAENVSVAGVTIASHFKKKNAAVN